MYTLIKWSPDGDRYSVFTDGVEAKIAFLDTRRSTLDDRAMPFSRVTLVKSNPGVDFGFGTRGELFGAELMADYTND